MTLKENAKKKMFMLNLKRLDLQIQLREVEDEMRKLRIIMRM